MKVEARVVLDSLITLRRLATVENEYGVSLKILGTIGVIEQAELVIRERLDVVLKRYGTQVGDKWEVPAEKVAEFTKGRNEVLSLVVDLPDVIKCPKELMTFKMSAIDIKRVAYLIFNRDDESNDGAAPKKELEDNVSAKPKKELEDNVSAAIPAAP